MPRIAKSYARQLSAMALAVGSLLSFVMSAQAYDLNSCNRVVDTFAIQQFTVDTAQADLGDDLWVGRPVGTAAICWSPGGRVAFVGKLYAQCPFLSECDNLVATAHIRFQRANGQFTRTTRWPVAAQGGVASREIKLLSPSGSFRGVNIRLFFSLFTALGPTGNILVAERNFQR
jgi:hypothetical protein